MHGKRISGANSCAEKQCEALAPGWEFVLGIWDFPWTKHQTLLATGAGGWRPSEAAQFV